MHSVTCHVCGVPVSVLDDTADEIFCPDCEEALERTRGRPVPDAPARPKTARPSAPPGKKSSAKKRTTSSPPAPSKRYPRWVAVAAATGAIALLLGGVIAGLGLRGGKPGAPGHPGRQQIADGGFEKVRWKAPFGGALPVEPLPRGIALPKEFFGKEFFGVYYPKCREFMAIGPGPFYLLKESQKMRQGRFDRDVMELSATERPLGDHEAVEAVWYEGGYFAAAATADGRVALQTRAATVVWGPDGQQPQCTIPLKTPIPMVMLGPFDEGDRELLKAWVGWAGERVLYLDGGKLVAFDPVAKTELFAVGKKYQRPILVAPNGQWLIVAVGTKHLEVLDAGTGECLGRFGGPGDWRRLALSPDGKRLAMVSVRGPSKLDSFTYVADLATGAIELIQKGYEVSDVAWLTPEQLLLSGRGDVYDLTKGLVEYRLAMPGRWGDQGPHFYGVRGDGQLLYFDQKEDGSRSFCLGVPQYPELNIVFGPHSEQPIEVTVDVSHDGFKKYVQGCAEESLRERGYRVASGGWKVAVKGEIVLVSSAQMKIKLTGTTFNRPIPSFIGKVALIDPQGKVLSEREIGGGEPVKPNDHFYDDLANSRRRKAWTSQTDFHERMLGIAAEVTAVKIEQESWPPIVVQTAEGLRPLPLPVMLRYDPIAR